MGKPREKKHPLEDNPFVEGFLDWMGSEEGQSSIEVSTTLWELMEDAQLDARGRKILWPDAQGLSIDQSVERIHKLYPQFPCENRKSTRLNSSHLVISYAVFCLNKKNDEDEVAL